VFLGEWIGLILEGVRLGVRGWDEMDCENSTGEPGIKSERVRIKRK
jgi:hypothetical protein